jgi:UDP-N-acetylmuramoyl-tripeptide--D-alanyl-D-alanine ligase
MAELGNDSEDLHHEAGLMARRMGIERLLSVGPLARHAARAFGDGASHFDDRESLTQALCEELESGVTVLIKGSRSMEMDVVVRTLLHGETECC